MNFQANRQIDNGNTISVVDPQLDLAGGGIKIVVNYFIVFLVEADVGSHDKDQTETSKTRRKGRKRTVDEKINAKNQRNDDCVIVDKRQRDEVIIIEDNDDTGVDGKSQPKGINKFKGIDDDCSSKAKCVDVCEGIGDEVHIKRLLYWKGKPVATRLVRISIVICIWFLVHLCCRLKCTIVNMFCPSVHL